MKLNFITLLITFFICALAGYGFYVANNAETDVPLANAIVGGIALFGPLAGAISASIKNSSGATVNIRIVSVIFFVVSLIVQIIFCFVRYQLAPYIIVSGILLLIYVLIAYIIKKTLPTDK